MDERGWSFLQALTKPTSSNCNKEEDDKVYVHPTVKRSSSLLSEKSLEMCTESLGSETGVENVEDEMGVKKFNRPSRCKESGNRDIFGDGYFELPSLSLCL
uniref:Uncharacterized protein n=1 Tax=Lotus japonicus TaxID=34305 RepID=I3T0W8_LOTJA|nr:unknown [Lotus japonicus]